MVRAGARVGSCGIEPIAGDRRILFTRAERPGDAVMLGMPGALHSRDGWRFALLGAREHTPLCSMLHYARSGAALKAQRPTPQSLCPEAEQCSAERLGRPPLHQASGKLVY